MNNRRPSDENGQNGKKSKYSNKRFRWKQKLGFLDTINSVLIYAMKTNAGTQGTEQDI